MSISFSSLATKKIRRHKKVPRLVHFPKTTTTVVPLENGGAPEFQTFLQSLWELKKDKAGQLKVFILGDSHMQCEDFGTAFRQYLIDSLGVPDAGRGFVFPYQLAKTSHRGEMLFGPSKDWRGMRFTRDGSFSDWGLAGWTAHWDSDSAIFHWRSTQQTFRKGDQILIFCPKQCGSAFKMTLSDSTNQVQDLKYDPEKLAFGGKIESENNRLTLNLKRIQVGSEFVLQGLLVQPSAPGLVCGISGTNGARLDHYIQNPDFQRHLRILDPDLMVISLGTNEALDSRFNPDTVRKFLLTFLSKIKSAVPKTAILLVGPPDHKHRKSPNPKVELINQVFSEVAEELDFQFWNQQKSMGGKGSIFTWRTKKLATTDMVHFTTDGYRLQAMLLGQSIREEFKKLKP